MEGGRIRSLRLNYASVRDEGVPAAKPAKTHAQLEFQGIVAVSASFLSTLPRSVLALY
jgi:hypothetical protein